MCKKLIFLVFCVSVLFSGVVLAELDDSGRLIVPETSVAPIIDGELDDVWQNVGEEGVLITEIINAGGNVPPDDDSDLSGTFKVMYDADNIYFFLAAQDSVIDYEFSNWNGDGVEIYFDGDNNKGGAYDGINDNQIRITVDDVEMANIDSSLPVDGSAFKVILTASGYNIEAAFPLAVLQLVPEQTFGFEVQLNDNDGGGGRETMTRWFSNDNNSWQDSSLFGEAILVAAVEVEKTVLFSENFDGLVLGPNVDEALAGDAVWTEEPPEGWSIDESGIPGIGMDATDGVTEWAGWAFTDKAWWTEAAGDQNRSQFELASGIVAVADPDEWDDDERLPIPINADPYDTWLTTPEIKIGAAEAGTLELKFDSSWRPEFDDNFHQTANITASFDGGDPVEVMLWESDGASANFHPDATNETVIVNLDNPEGAKNVVLTFGLFDAGNDWWWAIDNIEVRGVVPYLEPVNPGTDGLIASYALAGDATDGSGNGIDGVINNAETGGLGDGGSVWVDDPERGTVISFNGTAEGAFVRAGEIPQMTLTNDFTWSFWAKQNAENTANNDIIFGNRMDENAVDFVPRQFIKF
ncbi:MAG: sugar-binding protein, partial [Planctomycetota bacterium]